MYRCLFRILFVTIIVGFSFSGHGNARDYTARGSKSASQSDTDNICSKKDLHDIKRFNSKAKKHIKGYNKWMKGSEDVYTANDSIEFEKSGKKARRFFESDDYKAMEKVYKRCGKEMPRLENKPLYWTP